MPSTAFRIFALMKIKQFHAIATFATISILSAISPVFAQFPEITCYHQDPGAHERDRNIDVTHLQLNVKFNPEQKQVLGKVSHHFNSLQSQVDTIFLDGPGIEIISASLDGKPIKTRNIPAGVVCITNLKNDFQKSHILTLEYSAHPQKGIYFIGWNLTQLPVSQPATFDPKLMTRKQIWTQGQGIDNRNWIPMIDDRSDKFTTDISVEFKNGFNVLSNGQLASKTDNKNGTTTWKYLMKNQHAGYLIMLAIDNYAVKSSKTKNGTPIHLWYYPEHPERVEPTNRYSERIIEFLENETGIAYPWGSYSQVMVQDFMFGAMENTSATVFGDFFWVDNRSFLDRNYIGVNAHEATHQWFGDLITGRHDGEQWLQESFATFYPGLFMGSVFGKEELDWYFHGQHQGALAAGKQNSLPVRHSGSGSSRHYPKGASVLHMLKHILGDENYKRSINLYLQRHQFKTVETWDLQKAIIDATGINMDWFFDQWIHKGGEPHFKISWQQLSPATNSTSGTEITVEQIQHQDPIVGIFKTPVDIAVYYTDGSISRQTVTLSQAYQKIIIPNGDAPVETKDNKSISTQKNVAFVVFDEGNYLLKNTTFQRSYFELMMQAKMATNAIDRWEALSELKKLPQAQSPENIEFLMQRFEAETFRENKLEIANQLLDIFNANITKIQLGDNKNQLSKLEDFCIKLFSHNITEIRRAAVEKSPINIKTMQPFMNALKDSSYLTIELAINKMWENPIFNSKHTEMLEQLNFIPGYMNNLLVKQAELSIENFPDKADLYKATLVTYASPYYEFRTRINAMAALKRLNYLNEELCYNLFEASLSFNSRLAQPANELIAYFKQQTAYKRLLIKSASNFDAISPEQQKKLLNLVR